MEIDLTNHSNLGIKLADPLVFGHEACRRMSAESRRLTVALLFSLLVHILLLSLTFDGQGFGLPGFGFPWQERRIAAPDLYVVLMPAQVVVAKSVSTLVKAPLPQASSEQAVTSEPAMSSSVSSSPSLSRTTAAIVPMTKPEPNVVTDAVLSIAPVRTKGSSDTAHTQIPVPAVIAMEQVGEATWVVPPPSPGLKPAIAVAPDASIPGAVMLAPPDAGEVAQYRAELEVRERVVEVDKLVPPEREAQHKEIARQEAARIEAARLESERLETARLTAAKLEAQHQEIARQEAARIEAARLEAERLETARLTAAKLEAQHQEITRQEAARIETARLEVERLEAEGQNVRVLVKQGAEEKREARLRAIGRQLDEEAARRKVATAARSHSTLPYSLNKARRARLWGRADPNAALVQYAEAWARKIQFNTSVDTVREVAKRPHTDPMVTVSIRSNGSVEPVIFVVSSGVAEVDEAIRRIVQSHVHYQAFPPELAREFDVIEIRRTWHFDTAIRLN